jgi:hypothetical protein
MFVIRARHGKGLMIGMVSAYRTAKAHQWAAGCAVHS